MKLYYSPGAVSLAAHLVARELELELELVRTPTGDDADKAPAYLAVNPAGRVPALLTEGQTLTETPAILRALARKRPERGLYPVDFWQQARVDEILSRIVSRAQPAFRMVMRPDRVVDDAAAEDAVREAGRRDFVAILDVLDGALPDEGWAVGEQLTLADPYLCVMWLWARYVGADGDRWPRISRIARAVLRRPAAQATLLAEGLIDQTGRPTPPARV